jgi:hypothetical protein
MDAETGDVRRGRPGKGSELVDGLEGSDGARLRLKLVIETLAGRMTVEEACRQLSIGESRFHAMRREALAAAVSGLEPSPAGRPPKGRTAPGEAGAAGCPHPRADRHLHAAAAA